MTRARARRRLAPLILGAVLALGGAPAAGAQTTTTGASGGPSLSPAPPVSLGHSKSKAKTKKKTSPASTSTSSGSTSSTARKRRLPNTGYDAWAVALLGTGLMGVGFVLRQRTRDVRQAS